MLTTVFTVRKYHHSRAEEVFISAADWKLADKEEGVICPQFCSKQNANLGHIKRAHILCSLLLDAGTLESLLASNISLQHHLLRIILQKSNWRMWITTPLDIRRWHSNFTNVIWKVGTSSTQQLCGRFWLLSEFLTIWLVTLFGSSFLKF